MHSITIISSSPPRVFAGSPTPVLSSSPSLPSPDTLLHPEKSPYNRFKLSKPVRDGFGSGFTSAKSLLRPKFTAENLPVSDRSSQLSRDTSTDNDLLKSSSRSENDTAGIEDLNTKDKQLSNSRQRSDVGDNVSRSHERDHAKRTSSKAGEPQSKSRTPEEINNLSDSFLVERAAPRRLDWTPTKDSTLAEAPPMVQNTCFGSILESFTYQSKSGPECGNLKRQESGEAPTKKRKIELVNEDVIHLTSKQTGASIATKESSTNLNTSERRSKSPKKKSLTITARATAQYLADEEPETTSLVQYLNSGDKSDSTSKNVGVAVKGKRRAARPLRNERGKGPEIILLSPESAAKQYDSQELLFGSASQIAREESPTLLKSTIQAIKESEVSFSSTSMSMPDTPPISAVSETRRTSSFIGNRNLWAVASRDEDNNLLSVETIDLTKSPANGEKGMLKQGNQDDHSRELHTGQESRPVISTDDGWLDVDTVESRGTHKAVHAVSRPSILLSDLDAPRLNSAGRSISSKRTFHTKSVPQTDVASESATHNPSMNREPDDPSTNSIVNTYSAAASDPSRLIPQKPLFTGMTTTELSSQLKSYGFKPVKKRDKMIELLERCWTDKQDMAPPDTEPPVKPSNQTLANKHDDILSSVYDLSSRPVPKINKPRGRAKKISAAADVSSTTLSPEKTNQPPTKKQKSSKPSTSKKSKKEPLSTTNTTTPATTNQQPPSVHSLPHPSDDNDLDPIEDPPLSTSTITDPSLTLQITRAILSQKPSGRDTPTFHEKMLLYDPIVLEDLTAWLNTDGFRNVGEDREVGVLQVRTWCEERGVTCLGVGAGSWRAGRVGRKGVGG